MIQKQKQDKKKQDGMKNRIEAEAKVTRLQEAHRNFLVYVASQVPGMGAIFGVSTRVSTAGLARGNRPLLASYFLHDPTSSNDPVGRKMASIDHLIRSIHQTTWLVSQVRAAVPLQHCWCDWIIRSPDYSNIAQYPVLKRVLSDYVHGRNSGDGDAREGPSGTSGIKGVIFTSTYTRSLGQTLGQEDPADINEMFDRADILHISKDRDTRKYQWQFGVRLCVDPAPEASDIIAMLEDCNMIIWAPALVDKIREQFGRKISDGITVLLANTHAGIT